MKSKPKNSAAYIVSIILITLFFGCSVEQTHKTLVFFFDGVDQVIFHNDYLSHDSLGQIAAAKREALLKKNRPDMCVHKPYKEKRCDACHTPDKRLIMPMPGLCFKCHTNFSETYAVVHGPVASGACLNCHNQHSSKYAKLLIRQGQQICVYCHNPSLVFAGKVHRDIEDAECTMCHNPHGGKAKYMLRDNISRDANRIALMDELTYRHLHGQIFCKVPGDIDHIMEIVILDEQGRTVSTAHPDATGKFFLTNLHPDQNYTFRFKKDFPDCKINIYDNNGNLLYVIQKNRKGVYPFDKNAYETVHSAINDAHFLGDTTVRTVVPGNVIAVTDNTLRDTAGPLAIAGNATPGDTLGHTANVTGREQPSGTENNDNTTARSNPENAQAVEGAAIANPANNAPTGPASPADTAGYKGKIVVKEIPDNVPLQDLVHPGKDDKGTKTAPETAGKDTAVYKGNIKVTALPDDVNLTKLAEENKVRSTDTAVTTNGETISPLSSATSGKSKILVTTLPDTAEVPMLERFRPMAGAGDVVRKMEAGGLKLTDLSTEVADYYDGTVVCVLNESGDLIDIAPVNAQGEFYLYDFLYFRITMPPKNSGIAGQTIYINEKMEVIESIHKRVVNGRYVYIATSKEKPSGKMAISIFSDRENAVLFSSVYFEEGKASVTAQGVKALNKVAGYLAEHPSSNIYLVANARSMGTTGYNRHLAEQRASYTVSWLTSRGVKMSRIRVKGNLKGKVIGTFETTPGSDEETEKSRRVDVYIKL